MRESPSNRKCSKSFVCKSSVFSTVDKFLFAHHCLHCHVGMNMNVIHENMILNFDESVRWVNDICQLMDKNDKQGGAGKKSHVSSPKSKSTKVGSPSKAKGDAAVGAAVAATPTSTAKKRVQPNFVQQLGAEYRLGGAPAEPKPGENPSARGKRVGVGLLSKRKKQQEQTYAFLFKTGETS